MALLVSDRIKETTTTTGTGTYTLAGAVTGFETFTANLSNSDTTYYCCTDNSDFEVGLGTFTSSGTTLARTTILASSNSNSAVDWSSGTRTIFCTLPAAKAVILDASGNATLSGDLTVGDDLTLGSDSAVLNFGTDSDTSLTHTDGTGLTLNSTNKLTFGDAATFIHQSSDGVMTVDGEATIDLNASTAVLVSNDLKLNSDASVLGFGVDNDVTLTHVADSALLLNDAIKLTFRDSALSINSSTDGQLDIIADTEVQIAATTIDINGNVDISGTLTIGSAGISEAELEILDGASVTTTELNIIDGDATVGTTAVADGDGIVTNDAGTMRQTTVQTFATYFASEITAMSNLVTTGALDSGSITSGFGSINNGASAITTTGTITGGELTVDDVGVNGKVITMTGSTSDTATFTVGTNGTLDIVTTDDAAAAANIQITADGTAELAGTTVTLDSGGDIVLDANGANVTFKDDGTSILDIANNSTDVELTVSTADKNFKINGTDGSSAITALDIDMALAGKATFNGDVVVTGDLTITGDDLVMGTNTSGHMLVGDGTNYNPVAVSGDVSMASNGAVTIADNAVTLAKMAGLARGKIIVGDSSGDPSALALGSNGEVLQSDGSDLVFGSVTASALAADNLSAGDAAINLTTTSGNITIDAQDGDSDIIFKGTDGSSDTTFLTLDGSDAGTAIFNHDVQLKSDDSILAFGADLDVTITHDPDDGLILKSSATADNNPFLLTLQTGETDLAADDVIGKIQFQAPDEGTGTDAILVSGAIQARSEGDFSSSANSTSLDFMTGASEAATTKASLTSGGRLGVGTTSPTGGLHVKGNGEHGILNIQPGGTSGSTNMAYLRFLESGDDTTVGVELNASLEATNSMDLIFSTLNSNTLAECFRIQANGSVGIKSGAEKGGSFTNTGAAGGLARGFTVQHNAASSYVCEFRSEGNNSNRFGLILNYGADDNHSSTATAISFQDGDGTNQGSITSTNGTVNYGAFTANHDVYLPDADKQTGYPYGTLLECVSTTYKKSVGTNTTLERGIQYNVQKTSSKMSKAVMGAYASRYSTFYMPEEDTQYYLEGMTIPEGKSVGDVKTASTIPNGKVVGDEKVIDKPLHQVYILGDGHILCNNETGNIEIGDFITASSTAGIGMKATETGITCGIAREAVTFSSSSETKLVAVEYGIRQYVAS